MCLENHLGRLDHSISDTATATTATSLTLAFRALPIRPYPPALSAPSAPSASSAPPGAYAPSIGNGRLAVGNRHLAVGNRHLDVGNRHLAVGRRHSGWLVRTHSTAMHNGSIQLHGSVISPVLASPILSTTRPIAIRAPPGRSHLSISRCYLCIGRVGGGGRSGWTPSCAARAAGGMRHLCRVALRRDARYVRGEGLAQAWTWSQFVVSVRAR